MRASSKDPFEELKKISEKRNRKLKSAGKAISYLGLALCFGVGIFIAIDLGASLKWYRIAGILVIVLVFSFLSIWIQKKDKEKHSTLIIFIRLLITLFMLISVAIFYELTSTR